MYVIFEVHLLFFFSHQKPNTVAVRQLLRCLDCDKVVLYTRHKSRSLNKELTAFVETNQDRCSSNYTTTLLFNSLDNFASQINKLIYSPYSFKKTTPKRTFFGLHRLLGLKTSPFCCSLIDLYACLWFSSHLFVNRVFQTYCHYMRRDIIP